MRTLTTTTLLLAMAVVTVPSGHALTFEELPDLDEVAAMASLALRGEVTGIDYGYASVSEQQTIPYSRIRIAVGKSFAGAGAPDVTLRQIGGRLRDHATRHLVIPGLADLAPGDRIYVLANDRLQPFFATLFGDHSLFRLAQDQNERRLVLNAHWQIMATDGKRIRPVPNRYCEPTAENRGRCRTITREAGDVSDTHDVAVPDMRALDPLTFDAMIERWRAGSGDSSAPGQTVSGDDQAFASALAEFGRAVSAEAPEDEEDEIALD